MNKAFLFVLLIASLYSYSLFSKKEVRSELPLVMDTKVPSEVDVPSKDEQEMENLRKLSQKGITDRDIEAIKKNFVLEDHRLKNIRLVNGAVEMEFDKKETEDYGADLAYENEEDQQEYILSFNGSDQLPEISSEENELIDQVLLNLRQ